MALSIQPQLPNVVASAASATAALFKPGQVLEALVVGKAPEGLTALKIGDVVITAKLAQTLPPGTTLQFQVKAAGPTPQLVTVGAPQLPASMAKMQLPVLPLPTITVIPEPPSSAVVPNLQAKVAPSPPAGLRGPGSAMPTAVTDLPASPAAPAAPAETALTPQRNSSDPAPPPAAPTSAVPGARPQPGGPNPELARPIAQVGPPAPQAPPPPNVESLQLVTASAATIESTRMAAPSVPLVPPSPSTPASAVGSPLPLAAASPLPAQTQIVPAPEQVKSAQQSSVVSTAGPAAVPTPSASAAPAPSVTAVLRAPERTQRFAASTMSPAAAASEAAPAASRFAAFTPASPLSAPEPSTSNGPAHGGATPAEPTQLPPTVRVAAASPPSPIPAASPSSPIPAAPAVAAPTSTATKVPALAPNMAAVTSPAPTAAAEPVAPSPLLVAQGAARPTSTVADLPRAGSVPVAPTASVAATAATPAAALAQMIPDALARQNSVAPLLASLAAMVAKPGALPEPVLRAALQVLGQRVHIPSTGPTADLLESAVAKSGLYLEAALAKGMPALDLKSGLVALKGALATFLGGNPAPVTPARQVAPPLRGMPPRAEAVDTPPLSVAPRDAARALHSQADAALSRVKLMQLASLPDADPVRAPMPELRLEIPFLIGQELVMAHLQVFRDGARRHGEGKRGWTMRFAMNFAATGEVGAEVGLLGRSVNVALWAADSDTAASLETALPDLAPALASIGLEPGAVRVRALPPEMPKPASGQYVDSRR